MDDKKIGIIGSGFQGKAIAFWFAKRGFSIILYDVSTEKIEKIGFELEESAKRRALKKYIKATNDLNSLSVCDIIIENIPEKLELKQKVFGDLENIVKEDTVFGSNSSAYPPSVIMMDLKRKQNFLNIHFLGVNWGSRLVELIPTPLISEKALAFTKSILKDGGFEALEMGECPGFVFNRIKGLELSNIIRAYESELVDYDNMLKYMLYPIKGQWTVGFLDLLGLEISESIVRFMNDKLGKRYYVSKTLTAKVKNNELGYKTGKGFYDYSEVNDPFSILNAKTEIATKPRFKRIYIHNLLINQTNLLLRLIATGKEVYFENEDNDYFNLLAKIDKQLFAKIKPSCRFMNHTEKNIKFDMIMDSIIAPIDVLIQRLDTLSAKFGVNLPILINTPIYKIGDISQRTSHPSELIFGINSQKSYLVNTELVKRYIHDESIYCEVKNFIHEVTDNCVEVEDGFARPLMFLLIPKMFEAMRIVEEGAATKEAIEFFLDRDKVFKDIDYFGLDNLKMVSDYLSEAIGEPFYSPTILQRMLEDGKTGVRSGVGFSNYS